MSVDSVINEVLKEVKPKLDERRKTEFVIEYVKSVLEKNIVKLGVKADLVLVGSFAKDTWLSGVYDVDLFVRFENEEDFLKLKDIVKSFNPSVVHGSRDYFSARIKGFDFEFVPALKISSPELAVNPIDVTPFHVRYVKNKMSKKPDLNNEIRLFKLFCKAAGVYGAESYMSGFSPYVMELLLVFYGSFKKLITAFDIIRPKLFLDFESYYKSFSEASKKLSDSKVEGCPLILIDPLLPSRNAAAALGFSSFSKLQFHARKFLRNPSSSFFKPKVVSKKTIMNLSAKRGTFLYFYDLVIAGKRDVFLSKLQKNVKKIVGVCNKNDFRIYDYGILEIKNRASVYFEFLNDIVCRTERHLGPYVWVDSKNFDSFMKKWGVKVYVFEDRLAVDTKRKYLKAKKLLDDLIDDFISSLKR